MREILAALAAVAFVALLEGGRQLYRWSTEKRHDELRRRLRALAEESSSDATLLRQGKFAKSPALDRVLRKIPLAADIERLLDQADSRFTVAQVLAWAALIAAGAFVGGTALRLGAAMSTLFGVVGIAIVPALLLIARDRRSRKVSEQLPEALDMMSRSIRAGHAFTSAFEVVAAEMPEPVAVEFGRAFESQRLGLPVEQAIVQMTERSPGNRDLKIFAVSALIQKETGGNLAEILGNIAETIRARYRFYGKLRALTAEGRASGVVLGLLPGVMALILRIVNPTYMTPLFTDPVGRLFLIFACVSWVAGVAWLFSLTKVDI